MVRVRHETVANQTGKHVLDLVVEQPERKQGGLLLPGAAASRQRSLH